MMNNATPLLSIASITFFMQSMDTTMLYLAIPTMAVSLHQSILNMGILVGAYLLTVVMFTPVSGWLNDTFGYRQTYLLALALFAAGSCLCAASGSLFAISASRVIQGIGGGLMLPAVRVGMLKSIAPRRKLAALNKMTLLGLLGTLAGPLVSGLLVMHFSWRLIFLINLPLCLACFFLARAHMPIKMRDSGDFDLRGFLLMTPAIILLMLGFYGMGRPGVPAVWIMASFALALLLVHLYRKYYITTPDPLFSWSLFRHRTFAIGIAGNIGVRIFLASVPLALSLMLQLEFNYPPPAVSYIMLSFALGALLARFLLRRILARLGYRRLLLATTGLTAAALYSLTCPLLTASLSLIALLIMVVGMLSSVLYAAMNTLTFSDLTDDTYNTGNSLLTLSQLLSVIISVAFTFSSLRYLRDAGSLGGMDAYHALFSLMGLGLLLCCFIFLRLENNDGDGFIQGVEKLPDPKQVIN
ncbi:MFS transporter [Acerihabitans arboris]|uniref:MFS transporter n=1 Tax=Acerihabitans arboris TaxID=2691583 RepID=A0A845SQ49_9GAMM|nr:MFS transporter [Acerihabitans arboris]NDL63275.1 MFS transporter [Acerihabitans arboris]